MNLLNIIELNSELNENNKLTNDQWRNIIELSFQADSNFDEHVTAIYTDYFGYDYDEVDDLLTDIQNGDGDAFEIFIDNIISYFDE